MTRYWGQDRNFLTCPCLFGNEMQNIEQHMKKIMMLKRLYKLAKFSRILKRYEKQLKRQKVSFNKIRIIHAQRKELLELLVFLRGKYFYTFQLK